MLLYVLVALSAVGMVGASHYGSVAVNDFAPLQRIASKFGSPLLTGIVSIGAVTAMLGVLTSFWDFSAPLRWAVEVMCQLG